MDSCPFDFHILFHMASPKSPRIHLESRTTVPIYLVDPNSSHHPDLTGIISNHGFGCKKKTAAFSAAVPLENRDLFHGSGQAGDKCRDRSAHGVLSAKNGEKLIDVGIGILAAQLFRWVAEALNLGEDRGSVFIK